MTPLLVILLILLILPLFFKDPLMLKVKREVNENVNAEIDFDNFSISLISHFPKLSLKLNELKVIGIDEFAGDTIISLKSFKVIFNPISLLSKEGPEINSLIFDRPEISLVVLESGKSNWDIIKESDKNIEQEPDESKESGALKLRLRRFEIRDADIEYEDIPSNMSASLINLNFHMSGKLGTENTIVDLNAIADKVSFKMNGIPYLRDVILRMEAGIGADLVNMTFTLTENKISLNDLTLGFNGVIDLSGDFPYFDLSFNTLKTSFKSLISLIPAIYMSDFKAIETSGTLGLYGSFKGAYHIAESDTVYPDIKLNLNVENAGFNYPDLPASVEDVNIAAHLDIDGEDLDNSTVDIDEFSLTIAGNTISSQLHIRTPVSDVNVNGEVKGDLDLSAISEVVPVEGVNLKGKVTSDLRFNGRISSIEKEKYNEFHALGNVSVKDFEYQTQDNPLPILIEKANLVFSTMFLELPVLDMKMGESDFHFQGRLNNYLMFFLKDEQLTGNFKLTSSFLNLNELLPESNAEKRVAEADTTELSVIRIPENIDFSFSSELEKVIYGNLEFSQLHGIIIAKDGKLILDDLEMKLMDGNLNARGEYDTSDTLKPSANMELLLTDIDIPSVFQNFNTVKSLAPFAKDLKGKVSSKLSYSSLLGSDMMPLVPTISGAGTLQSKEVSLVSSKAFNQIKNLLKLDKQLTNTFKDVNISFAIQDGRVTVKPFDVSLGQTRMNISGDHGLDQTLNYLVKMKIPREYLGMGANQLIDDLTQQAASLGIDFEPGETIPVNFRIEGKIGEPKVSLVAGEGTTRGKTVKEAVIQEVKKEVLEQKEKIENEVREQVTAEIDKIMEQAEKEAENIKKLAGETAEQIRKEGYNNADKIVKEAEGQGFIVEGIAAKAAEKLREQTDKQANNIIKEANIRAEQILEEARKKTDELNK